MNLRLSILLFSTAVTIIAWSFERYRTNFNRLDLLIGTVISAGLLLLVGAPDFYQNLGQLFKLERRIFVVLLLSNIVFLVLIFYSLSLVRNTRQKLNELTKNLTALQPTSRSASSDGGRSEIAIVIPAYNEEENINSVVSSLPSQLLGHPVLPIVVSDGSDDNTVERVTSSDAIVVEHPVNQGQGGALQTGFLIAADYDPAVVVTMDADGQHPVDELPRLVGPVLEGEADFAMGSRYLGSNHTNNSAVREVGIRTFTWMINRLTKANITDCTNGFRAIRGSEIEHLTLTEEQFNAPELIIEAKKNSLRILEVPITIEARQGGETKKPQLGYALGLARTIIVAWLR